MYPVLAVADEDDDIVCAIDELLELLAAGETDPRLDLRPEPEGYEYKGWEVR
jgi:hypothetical protein